MTLYSGVSVAAREVETSQNAANATNSTMAAMRGIFRFIGLEKGQGFKTVRQRKTHSASN